MSDLVLGMLLCASIILIGAVVIIKAGG